MKKVVSLMIVLLLTILSFACNESNKSETPSTTVNIKAEQEQNAEPEQIVEPTTTKELLGALSLKSSESLTKINTKAEETFTQLGYSFDSFIENYSSLVELYKFIEEESTSIYSLFDSYAIEYFTFFANENSTINSDTLEEGEDAFIKLYRNYGSSLDEVFDKIDTRFSSCEDEMKKDEATYGIMLSEWNNYKEHDDDPYYDYRSKLRDITDVLEEQVEEGNTDIIAILESIN